MDRLRESEELYALLGHYVEATGEDHESWLDRAMAWPEVTEKALTQLHGELIAYGWIEMNLDTTTPRKAETIASCYRVTREGVKAYRQYNQPKETLP